MRDTDKTAFRIISQAFDSWNVQFRIDVSELLDQKALLSHLRRIKQAIADEYSMPETSMLFDGILRKTRVDDYVDVIVRISKKMFEKGNPAVHFQDGTAPDGTRYTHMRALLDIFYLDQFGKPVMLDRVLQAITEAKIPEELLDRGIVMRKLQEILVQQIPAKDIVIAKGRYPDVGSDAALEFFFQAVAEPETADVYYSSRKVNRGDLLCRKIPAGTGQVHGINVLGEILPARTGMDIEFLADSGATLSLDGGEAVAEQDGVVVVNRTSRHVKTIHGIKEIPQTVCIKVNPVLRIEGDRVIDIAASQTVEIIGTLHMGSRILTDCEVFVSGNVEHGSVIEAGDNITIDGQVDGATLISEKSIVSQKNVNGSTVSAKDKIIIKGTLRNSEAFGDSVIAGAAAGSRIVSRTDVILDRIEADENNIVSTICVGMFDFFKQRIRDNEIFIEKARENLTRIELLLGKEIMEQITTANIQTVFMRFLSRIHAGQDAHMRKEVEIYRKLIESVPPTRELIAQKEAENAQLLRRIAEKEESGGNVVIIREQMNAKAVITVNGVEAEVDALNSPARISSDENNNLIASLDPGDAQSHQTEVKPGNRPDASP